MLSFTFVPEGYAQCMMENVQLEQVINGSERVFEGEVMARSCYRDASNGAIYTKYTIAITDGLGRNEQEAHIITQGGVVDGYAQMVFPSLQMMVGDKGIFMCQEKQAGLQVYGISQGFYKYIEGHDAVAVNAHGKQTSVYELKREIEAKKGVEFKRQLRRCNVGDPKSEQAAITITDVSPSVVTAGTKQILTIKGSGFGNTPQGGKVSFKNANNGGSDYIDVPSGPHIISWSDTEIQVTVPTATVYGQYVAGSGPVKVKNASGNSALSEDKVDIVYAKSEIYYSGNINHTDVADVNGEGGYTFHFGPSIFNNEEVKTSFTKALHNWKCSTHINMTPEVDAPSNAGINFNDNISLVEFDVNNMLPPGILGSTVISYASCYIDGEIHWVMTEMDMLLNQDFVWHHGPEPVASGKYDFESAILHELGHAHLIQHNMNENSVMYYRLTTGQARRNLHEDSDIPATNHVMEDSEHLQGCYTAMIPSEDTYCDLVFTDVAEQEMNDLRIHPNPNNGQFFIDGINGLQARVEVYNAMGSLVLNEYPTSERLSVDLGNVATGIYYVKIFDGTELSLTQKVMVVGR